MDNVRTVRFLAPQGADDLYRCRETGKVYIRQKCDTEHVRWLTADRCMEGYEPSMPMKAGLLMRVVDGTGNVLFEETLGRKAGYSDTVAEKASPFWHEALEAQVVSVAKEMGLHQNTQKCDAAAHNFPGCDETGLYCQSVTTQELEKLRKVEILGVQMHVVAQKSRRNVCGREWTTIMLCDSGMNSIAAICGYQF